MRGRVDRSEFDAPRQQQRMPGELHRQITGKTACVLNKQHRDCVFGAVRKQRNETGALVDRIGTRDRCVVELGNDFHPAALGVGRHGFTLAPFAIFVRADVRGRPVPGRPARHPGTGALHSRPVVQPSQSTGVATYGEVY